MIGGAGRRKLESGGDFMSSFERRLGKQLGLFEAIAPAERTRIMLDATSWVEHVSSWAPDEDEDALMSVLLDVAGWEQRQRWMYDKMVVEPRLTAEYPVLAMTPVSSLRAIGERLSAEYGVPYDRAWLNLYRDHNASTAWHADKHCRREDCIVPVLSLGETRRFLIRPTAGGRSTTFLAKGGDLIVMGGSCQRDCVRVRAALGCCQRLRLSIGVDPHRG